MSNTYRKTEQYNRERLADAGKTASKGKEKERIRHEIEDSLVEYFPDIDYDCEGALPMIRIGHNAS